MEADLRERIDRFTNDLRQDVIKEPSKIAHSTIELLKRIVSMTRWANAAELLKIVRDEGKRMVAAQPSETVVSNMVRRVLKIIREEYAGIDSQGKIDETTEESLHTIVQQRSSLRATEDYSQTKIDLKPVIIEAIAELKMELENSVDNIAGQALGHIHSNEVILTAAKCRTVETFLKVAAKKRKFQVMVVESSPRYEGQQLATSLAKEGIETTLITDSAVFAIMSRVNKVIIGTHTVMADGGLKAFSGSHAIALAARHHSVPLIVCAQMYKLSPRYLCSYDQDGFNKFMSPEEVLKFSEGELLSHVHIVNPEYDYVPPELVTLFISSHGGNAPSYIYRLQRELYHADDSEI